jgi:fatty-acyl-CoA synthase
MREYYKRPEKTEEALRDGWFFSGDLAIQDDDGRITVLGRRDDAIVREGQYYQPLQIEDAALAIPGVDEAAALGLASGDPQSQSILLAIASQQALNSDQIHKALASVLPATLLPKHIVVSDELPHNNDNSGGRGKLAKLKIRQQYEHLEQLA